MIYNKNYSIKDLANRIAEIKYYDLPSIKVKTSSNKTNENYIPNLSFAKKLGFKAKISLDLHIKDYLNYYYDKKDKELITNISKKIMSEHLDQISYNIIGHLKKNFNNIKDLQFTGMGVGRNIIKKICRKSKWNYINLEDALSYSNIDAVNNLSTNTPSFLLTLLLKKIHE